MIHNNCDDVMIHNNCDDVMIHNNCDDVMIHNNCDDVMIHNNRDDVMIHNNRAADLTVSHYIVIHTSCYVQRASIFFSIVAAEYHLVKI